MTCDGIYEKKFIKTSLVQRTTLELLYTRLEEILIIWDDRTTPNVDPSPMLCSVLCGIWRVNARRYILGTLRKDETTTVTRMLSINKLLFPVSVIILLLLQVARHGKCVSTFQE